MASNEDIRAWGAENGFDVTGEKLPTGLRTAFIKANKSAEDEEKPPQIVRTGGIRGAINRAKESAPVKKVSKAKARVSLEGLITMGWNTLSAIMDNVNPPVARVLSMQAPVAGMVLEEEIRDTIADRVLQPIARASEGGRLAMALIGPPLLVGALTYRPDQHTKIVPLLRQSLRLWIDVAGDKLEKRMEQEKKFEEEYGKKVDEMIDWFMEPLVQQYPQTGNGE